LQEQSSLKDKTLSGMFWTFSDLIANQGLNFIIQIIFARLLTPRDFGVIGMITVLIAVAQTIVDSGFTNGLIREREVGQREYSTVFFFNTAVALSLYFIMFISANAISNFFAEPQLVGILKILGLVLVINSFGIIQRTILIRKIDFKTQIKVSVLSSIVSGIIGIIAAFTGYGIWSLVIRTLAKEFMQSVLLAVFNRWKPSLIFCKATFLRLFSFGWKLLLSQLLSTIFQNIYYLIIGKAYSANDLGYYTNASKLRDIACESTTGAIQSVSYPVLSSIQENNKKLKEGYRKITKNSAFLTFPIMIGLAAIADPLYRFLFGEKWLAAIPFFQILCFSGLLYPLHAINLNILKVKGRSDLYLYLSIARRILGVTTIGLVFFFKLGLFVLVWTSVFDSCISYFINSYFSADLLSYSAKEQIKDVMPISLISASMGILVYFCGTLLPCANFLKLITEVLIGLVWYYFLCRIFKIEELNTIFDFLKIAQKCGENFKCSLSKSLSR
jgi:O-antigen/teichoic acid export membrane protein